MAGGERPMFTHITVGASDLGCAERFHDGLLTSLGLIQRRVTPDDRLV